MQDTEGQAVAGTAAQGAGSVLDGVPGQAGAAAFLRSALAAPVHAYLFTGRAGGEGRALAVAFAAALVCPDAGCGSCRMCRQVLGGTHPDVTLRERTGAALSVGDAREIVRVAHRSPLSASRRVIILPDIQLVDEAGPALLKTLEEPPAWTVFVLLADHVGPRLATIASRCVEVRLQAPAGLEVGTAALAGLADSTEAGAERAALWKGIVERLDGTGCRAVQIAGEIQGWLETRTDSLRAAHKAQLDALTGAGVRSRARGADERALTEQQRRELRRMRTDELRAGLGLLIAAYRDRLVRTPGVGASAADPRASTADPGASAADPGASAADAGGMARRGSGAVHGATPEIVADLAAVAAIEDAARSLVRNPNETLLLEALLCRLGGAVPA